MGLPVDFCAGSTRRRERKVEEARARFINLARATRTQMRLGSARLESRRLDSTWPDATRDQMLGESGEGRSEAREHERGRGGRDYLFSTERATRTSTSTMVGRGEEGSSKTRAIGGKYFQGHKKHDASFSRRFPSSRARRDNYIREIQVRNSYKDENDLSRVLFATRSRVRENARVRRECITHACGVSPSGGFRRDERGV